MLFQEFKKKKTLTKSLSLTNKQNKTKKWGGGGIVIIHFNFPNITWNLGAGG